jgi:predicted transcriptional regulator
MKDVPSINLYLDKETKELLQQVAEKENRSPSKQVKHMLEYYIKNKVK